jgi:hypothetical protein
MCSLKSMVIVSQTVNLHNIYDIVTGPLSTIAECVLTMRAEIALKCKCKCEYHGHKFSLIKVLLPSTPNENSVTLVAPDDSNQSLAAVMYLVYLDF